MCRIKERLVVKKLSLPARKPERKPMQRILKFVIMLASLVLSSACSKTLPRVVTAEEICRDWRHQTVSKSDRLTEKTASTIESGNKSRPAWGCAYGRNEAKG